MFFRRRPAVVTDPALIDEALSRSVAEVLPSKDALAAALAKGKRLRFYIGVDATGSQLHLGHATNFLLMEKLRRLGHEIIILFGDFTALIGDPSGHDSARKQLTEAEVAENIRTWKAQVAKVVALDDAKNPARILRNSAWLGKLRFQDVIRLAANFTVQHMIERDLFERRLAEGKPLYLNEFLYPVMQGYDSVAMDVDAEVGGTDQTFNMLAGRILQQKINHKEKFVIATTLLENPKTGQKLMSKSVGNFIALDESAPEMFGKVMALPDEVVRPVFVDCTLLSIPEIDAIAAKHPKEAKEALAKEIVRMYHGEKAAEAAAARFSATFSKGEAPKDALEIRVGDVVKISDFVDKKVVSSNAEFRRLLESGAIRIVGSDEKVTDLADIPDGATLRIGKHRFVKIVKK